MRYYTIKVLLDLDGVLCNFNKGALKLHGLPENYTITNYQWYIDFNMDVLSFFKPMNKTFWEELDRTSEFDDILKLIESIFGQSNICLLTAPPMIPYINNIIHNENIHDIDNNYNASIEKILSNIVYESVHGKIEWIHKHLPQYKYQFLIGNTKYFCANTNHILIDDYDKNIELFVSHGGIGILLAKTWNSKRWMMKYRNHNDYIKYNSNVCIKDLEEQLNNLIKIQG